MLQLSAMSWQTADNLQSLTKSQLLTWLRAAEGAQNPKHGQNHGSNKEGLPKREHRPSRPEAHPRGKPFQWFCAKCGCRHHNPRATKCRACAHLRPESEVKTSKKPRPNDFERIQFVFQQLATMEEDKKITDGS